MIYEVRTYTLKPGTVPEAEARFGERLPKREKFSKLGAFWHTEMGPLNQIIHVWPYEDLNQRAQIRKAAVESGEWPPPIGEFILSMEAEVFNPAPFMKPLDGQRLGTGNIYEMRIYTYQVGVMPRVLEEWEKVIEQREQLSPLAACWYSELGALNKFVHVWPYKSLEERARIRAEATNSSFWPPATRQWLLHQENKILVPASFSPIQ